MLTVNKLSYRAYKVIEENHEYNEYFVIMDITFDNDKGHIVGKFSCNCPYFVRKPGRICKHIKEVLLKWR